MTATAGSTLARARSFLGFVEGPRNNETPFGTWAGAPLAAWCQSFVSFVLDAAGVSMGRITYCPTGVAYWRGRGRLYTRPKAGDIFYLYFPTLGRYAHCGFVAAVDGDYIVTIEGNSNNAGSRTGGAVVSNRRHWAGTRTVFGRPDYAASATPAPTPAPSQEVDNMTLILTSATPDADNRLPFYELRPSTTNVATVVAHNGAKLLTETGRTPSGLPYMELPGLTGRPLGLAEWRGRVVVTAVGSGTYVVSP